MTTYTEIPTSAGQPFRQRTDMLGVLYTMHFRYNLVSDCWIVDIWDDVDVNKVITGIPLVTGCDLLEQFGYLPIGANAILTVMTIGPGVSPDTPPTFDNLGADGHVFVLTP